jgi:hypothetical protein
MLKRAMASAPNFKQTQTEAVTAGLWLALDHAVAFQNHQEAVGGALVQLEFGRQLHQADVVAFFRQSVDDCLGAVQYLDTVGRSPGLTI